MSVKDNYQQIVPSLSLDFARTKVNVRVLATEDAAPLQQFSIDPQPYPMRVWG